MEPHERLKSWLLAANLKPAEMARRCQADASNFHKVLTGQSRPSFNMAARIERETGGAILASAWVRV